MPSKIRRERPDLVPGSEVLAEIGDNVLSVHLCGECQKGYWLVSVDFGDGYLVHESRITPRTQPET